MGLSLIETGLGWRLKISTFCSKNFSPILFWGADLGRPNAGALDSIGRFVECTGDGDWVLTGKRIVDPSASPELKRLLGNDPDANVNVEKLVTDISEPYLASEIDPAFAAERVSKSDHVVAVTMCHADLHRRS